MKPKVGYMNSEFSEPRKLYRSSSLARGGNKYIVGMPMDFSDDTNINNCYKRILLPTSFSLEEVVENFLTLFEETYSMKEEQVCKRLLYNGIEVTSFLIGTIDELKISDPAGFHEETEEYPKFKQKCECLYYYDLKISARTIII